MSQLIEQCLNFLHVKIVAIIFVILLFFTLVSVVSNLHIPKFVLETEVPYIRDILQFFKYVVAPQNWRENSENGRAFLLIKKDILK